MNNLFKSIIALVLAVFVLSVLFNFLFRIGILMLIGLGIVYLIKRIFPQRI